MVARSCELTLTRARYGKNRHQPTWPVTTSVGADLGLISSSTRYPAGADPLGPENKLVISAGPLSGMLVPGGGKTDISTKSPLTGGYAGANVGGMLSAEMRFAGYDSIILEGISDRPVYVFIDNDRVEIRDASDLWGKGCMETEQLLKKKLGEEFQVAVIGPAGENLVKYAVHRQRLWPAGRPRRRGDGDGLEAGESCGRARQQDGAGG